VLRLFPLWSGEDASFRSLRSVGAFLVSASLSNHSVHDVEIWSEAGELCHLQSPWGGGPVAVRDGAGAAVTATKTAGSRDVFAFATQPGEWYSVVDASD
jgi:alpha-L-fucosidase 2